MRSPAEQFAAATDLLLAGATAVQVQMGAETPELVLADGLHKSAAGGMPDPAFIVSLRQELLALATMKVAPRDEVALHYASLDTPIGRLALAYRDGRVLYCTAFDSDTAFERRVAQTLGVRPQREPALPEAIERAVRDHLSGRKRFTAADLSWLPTFQRKVLEKTAEIPRGEVRPYSWIAREIGSPGAVRAVGTALGHNPIPFLIPCHRVVRADGSLGEYSGGGPAVKERVLTFEGAPLV
ncbi:MAG: methylated-DNA--[protein]-cysteine S-methyltransferase, partial [Dehalococcoidia bacterium]